MSQAAQPTALDRLMTAFRALVRAEFPQLTYSGLYEYQVQSTNGTTFDGSPTDTTIALPPIVGVPLRPGLAGSKNTPEIGSLVLVTFVNSDPTRPVVVSYDANDAQAVQVGAVGPAAARKGDVVNAGYLLCTSTGLVVAYFPGTLAGLAAATSAAAAMVPTGQVIQMNDGRITSGSSKVTIG